jgi:polar amino acid transport system substrate-binding protein
MKRFLAIILAGLMLLSLAACGGKDDKVFKMGLLEAGGMEDMYTGEHEVHMRNDGGRSNDEEWESINYNNLSSALLDLQSGNIALIGLNETTANYVAARDEKIIVAKYGGDVKTNFSMMTLDSNKEVYDILGNAIKDMKADGALDSLIANELKAYIESEPVAKDLPHFDGAKTIKIGVTGDIPPMDFVAANGKAAGFNIALLTEIANRAQVNIELVQIETGARAMALSSGKVDAVFWTKSRICGVCSEERAEKIDGTLVTESYFSDYAASLVLKSEK